jgi:tetratricopeptide (TPR) repeat protein
MKNVLKLLSVFLLSALSILLPKVSSADNEEAEKIFLRGYKKQQSGNLRAAEKMYTEALLLNTASSEIYFRRGRTRYELATQGPKHDQKDIEKKEEAMSDFQKAIDFNPSYSEAFNFRGIVKLELGDTTGALADHNKAIELNPNYADAYYQRGFVKMQQKNYKEAIKDYNTALEFCTSNGYMYLNRGYAYYLSGNYNRALHDIHVATTLMPENPYVFKIKALTEIAMKNYNAACESIGEALGLGYTEAYGDDLEKLGRKNCR